MKTHNCPVRRIRFAWRQVGEHPSPTSEHEAVKLGGLADLDAEVGKGGLFVGCCDFGLNFKTSGITALWIEVALWAKLGSSSTLTDSGRASKGLMRPLTLLDDSSGAGRKSSQRQTLPRMMKTKTVEVMCMAFSMCKGWS